MTPHREAFSGIEHPWIFYCLAALAVACFVVGCRELVRRWLDGRRTVTLSVLVRGAGGAVLDGVLFRRLFRGDPAAGAMHVLVSWGFVGLFVGTMMLTVDHYVWRYLEGGFYLGFSVAMEVCGLALVGGTLWAIARRYLLRVPRLERRASDLVLPAWLLAIGATGFLVEGAGLAATRPAWAGWSFAGALVAGAFPGPAASESAYPVLWWIHAVMSLALVGWLPWSRLVHALAAPLELALADIQSPDVLARPAADDGEPSSGTGRQRPDMRHLVSLDACTRCGRCDEVCPSARAGEPLSPRAVVRSSRLREQLAPGSFLDRFPVVRDRRARARAEIAALAWGEAWYCTTCRACVEACPVRAEPIEAVRAARAEMIEAGSDVPPKLVESLERLNKYENPWLAKKGQKAKWSGDLDLPDLSKAGVAADWLYFVDCTTSLDTRAQGMARALAVVLRSCGVAVGTLGKKEPCCGDIARRVGEQGLLEEQRDATLSVLRDRGSTQVVCSSPHCWNTIRELHPALHSSQLLARLLDEGKLTFEARVEVKATYHDPCYLSRYGRVLDEPRRVIRAIPGVELVEMAEHGLSSVCCGGGGGRMWQELPGDGKLAHRRLAQAAETGASLVVTSCPLCLIMLEDARKTGGFEDRLEVIDLAELVARALRRAS
jgi:Fe-S oxidoreductase/nitrate reductase gamma subunit